MRKEFLEKKRQLEKELMQILKNVEDGKIEYDVEKISYLEARLLSPFDLEEALETANTDGPQKEPIDTLKIAHEFAKERDNSDIIEYLRSTKDWDYFLIMRTSEMGTYCGKNVVYGISRHTGEVRLIREQFEYGLAAGWE